MKGSKMKKMKKRILAALLCTTMMLNTGMSAMADGGTAVSSESAHVHTEECYEKSKTDNLICTKAEAAEGHVHGDTCYEVTSTPELICTQAETAGHTHDDSCMETTKNLTCGTEEHTHGGDCYETETKDVCSDESEEHTCGDGCVETEEVLTCTAEEHTHDDGCYESETNIVCGQNEVEAHTHGEGCYTTAENKVLKCILEEVEAHTHNDDCYAWEEKLVCTLPETAPAAEQPEKEEKAEEAAEVNLQNDDETGIKVSVKSTSDVIPEDTKVVVASMEMDEEHETALAEAVSEFEVLGYTAYDISLKDAEDEDITLGENKVEVTIDFEELIPEGINAEEIKDVVLVHITTDEEKKLTAETVGTVEITEEKATVEFEADSFSPYVVTYLSEAEEAVEEVVVEETVEDVYITLPEYEDEEVIITISGTENALQNVVGFNVTPIKEDNEETKEQYAEVAQQLEEKIAEENEAKEKEVVGFLAYDITLVDAEGNELEPQGDVRVSMEYKEAAAPEAVEDVEEAEVTIHHFEEDEKGEVKQIVDMVAEKTIEAEVTTIGNAEVEKAEFVTKGFSVFTITWIRTGVFKFGSAIHYGYYDSESESYVGFGDEANLSGKSISSTGTPPTLYIDTISPTGDNNEFYTFKYYENDYYFAQAYVAAWNETDNTYTLLQDAVPVIAVQAKQENVVRYMLKDAGEYTKLESNQCIFFEYTLQGTTTAACYTENGTSLNRSYTFGDKYATNNGIRVDNTENKPSDVPTISNYKYAYVLINKADREIVPVYMRSSEGILQYRMTDSEAASEADWLDVGNAEIRLIYVSTAAKVTCNTEGIIDISLYDYPYYKKYNSASQIVSDLWFIDDKPTRPQYAWNNYQYKLNPTNGSEYKALQGIVKDSLYINDNMTSAAENYKGYPVLATGATLAPLFGGTSHRDVTAYTGLNHLFQMDDEGYYYYDSNQNAAYYDTTSGNKNFVVYNEPSKYNSGTSKDGQFMPFLQKGQNAKNQKQEVINNQAYHFGMNVGFNFTQPEGGLIDEEPMKFKFSGDDDVWVFIDGKLVLDIGGIHQEVTGTIDFSTGQVLYDNNPYKVSENYGNAVQQTAKTVSFASIFGEDNLVNDTFADNTVHRLEFFYLERGAGYSNCNLRFNIRPQRSNTIEIEKQITNTDKDQYADIDFDFKVYLEDERNTSTYDLIPEKTPYTLKKNGTVVGTGSVRANGIITLKDGESAVFDNIHSGIKYYVEEVAVSATEFDQVIVNDKEAEYYDQYGNKVQVNTYEDDADMPDASIEYIASTPKVLVGEVGKVVFKNRCSTFNKRELKITKAMTEGQTSSDSFTFDVQLKNTDGELESYVGPYYLYETVIDGEGREQKNYWTYEGDKLVNKGTEATVCRTTTDGSIPDIKVGYTVSITQLLSGTEFSVTESGLDSNTYLAPTYSVKENTADDVEVSNSSVVGTILLGKDAEVTVTNSLKPPITVTKTFVGLNEAQIENLKESFEICLVGESDQKKVLTLDENVSVTSNEDKSTTYTWTLNDLPEGTYSVYESVAGVEGYSLEINLNGTIVDLEDEETMEPVSVALTDMVRTISFQNTYTELTIDLDLKKTTINGSVLSGAEFEFYNYSPDSEWKRVKQVSVDNADGVVELTELVAGRYKLVEVKAPTGCTLLGEDIYFTVENTVASLTDAEGNALTAVPRMWMLDANNNILTVKNDVLYELPSTGGHGIYTTMLSGFALMLGAAYVWFTSRREESSNK